MKYLMKSNIFVENKNYIKTYEGRNKKIELISYPEGTIIKVSQLEFDELRETDLDISWDDEVDYYHGQTDGQWRYLDDEEEELEEWLKEFRKKIKKIGGEEAYKNSKKFNL